MILSMTLIAFFFLTGLTHAQVLSLKFTGSFSTVSIGDYNDFGEGVEKYISDFAELTSGRTSGEFKRLNLGFEYGGEILLKIYKGFEIGVGVEYIQRNSKSEFTLETPFFWNLNYTIEPYFEVIPIKLSVYYFMPAISPLKLFLNAGVGYYFGKITNTSTIGATDFWSETNFEVKDRAFGFHGGIGLEIKLAPRVVLFLEGEARYCKLKSWEGEETYQDSDGLTDLRKGTLFYYEKKDTDTGNFYPTISMDIPIGIYPEHFEADISGFSLRTGIIIKF